MGCGGGWRAHLAVDVAVVIVAEFEGYSAISDVVFVAFVGAEGASVGDEFGRIADD